MTLSLKQHYSLLPLPSQLRGGQTFLFLRAQQGSGGEVCGSAWVTYGKWRKYLYSCGTNRRRSREGHSTEISSRRHAVLIFCLWPEYNREFKERVLLLFLPPLLHLTVWIVGSVNEGMSPSPNLHDSITLDLAKALPSSHHLPSPCLCPPPPTGFKAAVSGHLGFGPVSVSSPFYWDIR